MSQNPLKSLDLQLLKRCLLIKLSGVRIPDVSLIFKNTIISIVFLFIFYVTHEYIKQYADVAEFFVLERQFKIGQTLIDLSIV